MVIQVRLRQICLAWIYRLDLVRYVSHGYTDDTKSDMFHMAIQDRQSDMFRMAMQVRLSQICFAWLCRLEIVRNVLHSNTGAT